MYTSCQVLRTISLPVVCVAQCYASYRMLAILPLPMPCQMDDFGIITRTDRLPSPAALNVVGARRVAGRLAYSSAA